MIQQTEALRLAAELDAYHTAPHHKEAAAEMRRLESVNAQLLEALTKCISLLRLIGQGDSLVVESGEAAIKAAKGGA
jgi:hypothetical protein